MSRFPEKKLQEIILKERGAEFNNKLKEFKQQYQKGNQDWIHKSIRLFKRLLLDDTLHPMSKMYVIKVLKECFETGNYGMVILIEVEILPIFKTIAMYKKASPDPNRGKTFFTDSLKNEANRQQYEKIGNSYLRFVLQCIKIWAQVKPHYYLADIEIPEQASGFAKVFKQTKDMEKVAFPQKNSYFTEAAINNAIQNFKVRFETLLETTGEYLDYYKLVLAEGLEKPEMFSGEDMELLRRLYKYPDVMLVEDATQILRENLEAKKTPPGTRLLSLQLLNELFEDGLLETVNQAEEFLPHMQSFVGAIDSKDTSLKRGEKALPGFAESNKYYQLLLKSLLCWAESVPKDPLKPVRESKFKGMLEKLITVYEFPVVNDGEVRRFRNSYIGNAKDHSVVNGYIAQQLGHDKQDKSMDKSIIPSVIPSTAVQQSVIPSRIPAPPPSNPRPPTSSNSVPSSSPPPPPLPANISSQSLSQRFSTIQLIYSYLQRTTAPQKEDAGWVGRASNYLGSYNNTFDEFMEENIDNMDDDDFKEATEKGYDYMAVNGKITKILATSEQHADRMAKIKTILREFMKQDGTPGGNTDREQEDRKMREQEDRKRKEQEDRKRVERERIDRERIEEDNRKKEIDAKKLKEEDDRRKREEEDRINREKQAKRKIDEQAKKREQDLKAQIEKQKEIERLEALQRDRRQAEIDHQIQRQKQIERQKQLERQRQAERRRQLDRQKQIQLQKQLEKERQLEKQREIERLKQIQRQKQQQRLKEFERLRQKDLERQRQIQRSRQSQSQKQLERIKEKEDLPVNSSEKVTDSRPFRSLAEESRLTENRNKAWRPVLDEHPKPTTVPSTFASVGKMMMMPDPVSAFHSAVPIPKPKTSQIPQQIDYKPSYSLQPEQQNYGRTHELSQHQRHVIPPSVVVPFAKSPASTPIKQLSGLHPMKGSQSGQSNFGSEPPEAAIQQKILSKVIAPKIPNNEQHSQILQPELEPMNNSFHEMEDFRSVVSETPSFKNCFEIGKFLLPSKTVSGKQKVFWLEQDSQILAWTPNRLRTESVKASTSQGFFQPKKDLYASFVTLPELLAQRTDKFDGELKVIQSRHRQEVLFLEDRIKKLEDMLREKDRVVQEQQLEIRTLKEGSLTGRSVDAAWGMTPQRAEYIERENMLLKSRLNRNGSADKHKYQPSWAVASSPMTPISHKIDNSIKKIKGGMKQPKGRLFFADPYVSTLSDINTDTRTKKLMLKNKQLLFQDDKIQIGAIITRDTTLKVALFIQSQVEINDFEMKLSGNGLKASWYPQRLPAKLVPGKQEKIIYSFELPNGPYSVPYVEFSYSAGRENRANRTIMPCSFNRFIEYKETNPDQFKKLFKAAPKDSILRGPTVFYNRRILKQPNTIPQLITRSVALNPHKEAQYLQGSSCLKYGVICEYKQSSFLLRVCVKSNQSVFLQAVALLASAQSSKTLQYLLSTLTCLLGADRQWP